MSLDASPIVPPIIAVPSPITATNHCKLECSNNGNKRAIKNTPAVTIVAECSSVETGVGPSIASESHACSGSCADLPTMPASSPPTTHEAAALLIKPKCTTPYRFVISNQFGFRNAKYIIASKKPKSPIRVIKNALRAADTALGLSAQNAIRKYEHKPTSSQNMNICTKLRPLTSPSILAVKSAINAKNRA